MNKTIMMGRLTRDPETRYTQGANQTAVARFTIAVDRKTKREGEPTADFFNCIAFGKQAEFVDRYLRKAIKIVLCGRFQNNNYTDKDGQKVYSYQLMVEEIDFAESKAASENGNAGGNNNSGYGNAGTSGGYNPGGNDGFMNIPDGIDEELPFN